MDRRATKLFKTNNSSLISLCCQDPMAMVITNDYWSNYSKLLSHGKIPEACLKIPISWSVNFSQSIVSFYGRPACGQEHLFYSTKTVTFLSLDFCLIVSSRLSKGSLCVCSIIETQIYVTIQKCRVYHIIIERKQSNWIPCFLCTG